MGMCFLLVAMSTSGCTEFAAINREINGPSNAVPAKNAAPERAS
jgi:hypothetical protein